MDRDARITTREAASGKKSLEITYRNDKRGPMGGAWRIPAQNEYYFSYKVKFEPGFDFDGSRRSGGKLPGLAASGWCSGGAQCTGTNGFTARYMWGKGGRAKLYLYHMDMPSKFGHDMWFKDRNGKAVSFKPGRWHHLVQRVKINTGGKRNGEVDVWMDGRQVVSARNIRFVTNGQRIDSATFSTFFGGNGPSWFPERDVRAYFDDFVVSTRRSDVGL